MALFGMHKKKDAEEAKSKAEPKEKMESFALDLNAENVMMLYKKCRPSDASKEVYSIVFQQKNLGFSKDSAPLLLDAAAVKENLSYIWFLFGQLQTAHQKKPYLPIKDVLKKYDGTFWTKDKAAPMYLMHLGIAAAVMLPPDGSTKTALIGSDLAPTFSPNDPLFDEWIKHYTPKASDHS